jgi:hypothetical protein
MPVEGLPNRCLYDCLAAHVEILGGSIQFFEHGGRDVHIYTLNRLDHAAQALEKARDVLPLVGKLCDRLG